jgi:hypothetical protein
MRFRQWMLSGGVFVVVLGGLVAFDERFRDTVAGIVSGGRGVTPWGDRVTDLGGALFSAVRYQSIENAPLLIFATVGAMLFLFMVKT